jgi:phosphatidylinositol-3,4,5-trisphosphate 3-phosphatase/dual-specificity protein phosphatase PTEN
MCVRVLVIHVKSRAFCITHTLTLTLTQTHTHTHSYTHRSISGLYRNNMKDVQNFFSSYHDGNYKVYNLCAEYQYDANAFGGSVAVFPFQDHNPPKFEDLVKICEDTDEFVTDDDDNVVCMYVCVYVCVCAILYFIIYITLSFSATHMQVAIHCKAGKGRTGTVIACHLLFQRTREDATEGVYVCEHICTSVCACKYMHACVALGSHSSSIHPLTTPALAYFGAKRTTDAKGVTIPSQARYVGMSRQVCVVNCIV